MPTTTRIYQLLRRSRGAAAAGARRGAARSVSLPGVGMSVMEISHRSKTFEDLLNGAIDGHPRAGGRSGELQDPDAAGRRQPAVLDGADEPARAGGDGRLHRHRDRGRTRRSRKPRRSGRSTSPARPRRTTTRAFPRQSELKLTPGAAYVHITTQQHDRGHGVEDAAGRRATCRSSRTRRPTSSAVRSTSGASA